MKYFLQRALIVLLAIITGVAGTLIYAFFPSTLFALVLSMFIIAAVLAWYYNETMDAEIEERYRERFKDNPDVLEEDK